MKRKIIRALLLLFIIFASGAIFSAVYIKTTTASLERLINLHQIENLRKDLIMSIQTVQSELYTVGTLLGHKIDTITESVTRLEVNAANCTGCHHEPEIENKLRKTQQYIRDYQNSLSFYITASANKDNIDHLKMEAAAIGNEMLKITEQMSFNAREKLASMTAEVLRKIQLVKIILVVTIVFTFIVGIFVALGLTNAILRPIDMLVTATRTIASGNLGYMVSYKDKSEFGELADNFNAMSSALREGYEKLEQEITERRHTEAALIKSEAFLNTIFDSIHDPFCIFDREFRIVRANEAYASIKAAKTASLTDQICYMAFHGRDTVCNDCIVSKTFLSGDMCAKEKKSVSPDGLEEWHEIYTYPILDSEGAITHVIEYTRDITERKRAEAALRESEQRYALAAQGANDGLWDWNLGNNRIYYSVRWKSMLGYNDRDIGDSPEEWFSRIHSDDREKVWSRINNYLNQGDKHFEIEYRILHKNGTFLWMLCRGIAVKDSRGTSCRMAGSQTDISSRKLAEDQLIHDAFHDALTGLANRALFRDRLEHAIDRSKRKYDNIYAVMFLDVDRFKVINDSLGHAAGDKLLIEISKRINACIRPGDTVARLGGDEFAVLLENINDVSHVKKVVDRIQREFEPAFILNGNELYITQSIGIALELDRYEEPDQILCDADIAMYAAKSKGKARYEIFDDGMHNSIMDRLQLEADLRIAVEHLKDFVIHYQPILKVEARELVGFEALVRWQHPRRGLIAPMDFIPLAEETGLIHSLGLWILKQACVQMKLWRETFQTPHPLKMSVNVSGKQLLKEDFVDLVLEILNETGIDPHMLAIEFTESIVMENIDIAMLAMNRLREIGVHIHIDDFGTGYSSLSYLHKFPVTALKIDRSFITNMSLNEENREIVRTIIALAQNLNLKVIAEGIELSTQLEDIGSMDCNFVQGYFFSKAMSAFDISSWMQREELVKTRLVSTQ